MALYQGLQQKLQQKLSPQQIQLMKLLQIPTATLEQRIQEELEANPALEEGDAEAVLVLHLDTVGVDQFRAAFGAFLFRRPDLDRAAVVHAERPLDDVEMMRAPVAVFA